jgi:NADPH:quinone reductase-like Zn-dependent oxidoreductase
LREESQAVNFASAFLSREPIDQMCHCTKNTSRDGFCRKCGWATEARWKMSKLFARACRKKSREALNLLPGRCTAGIFGAAGVLGLLRFHRTCIHRQRNPSLCRDFAPRSGTSMKTMRAVFQSEYGDPQKVLTVAEVPVPRAGPGEVLVRVHAASVHADVWHVVRGIPYILRWMGAGARRPNPPIPGTDLAGTIVEIGAGVARFSVGDRVFGESTRAMQWRNGGTFAQYACAPADVLARIPEGIGFEDAACIPTAGIIAWNNLRGESAITNGQHVLINGAAGGVGRVALQIAKSRGAIVTGVDCAAKLDTMRHAGADHVIDYQNEDVIQGSNRYDLIFDVASNLRLRECRKILRDGGIYVVIGHDHYGKRGHRILGSLPRMLGLMARATFDRNLPRPDMSLLPKGEVMAELATLLANGALKPIVHATYPLDRVKDAMRELENESVIGKILIAPQHFVAPGSSNSP